MLKALNSSAPMRAVAAAALAISISTPVAATTQWDGTYWYATGEPSLPDGQLWVNSYGECWQALEGATNLPPCFAAPPEEITVHLNFEFDKYLVPQNVINQEEVAKIDEYIDQLETTPEEEIVSIVGHCSAEGSDEYNMALGMRRADAVRDYIIGRGYPADHVAPAESEGKRDLLPGVDPYSWEQRRVVITKS
jgi:OOP family OmpA-OmpF porin